MFDYFFDIMKPFEPSNVRNTIRKKKKMRFSIKIKFELSKSITYPLCTCIYVCLFFNVDFDRKYQSCSYPTSVSLNPTFVSLSQILYLHLLLLNTGNEKLLDRGIVRD